MFVYIGIQALSDVLRTSCQRYILLEESRDMHQNKPVQVYRVFLRVITIFRHLRVQHRYSHMHRYILRRDLCAMIDGWSLSACSLLILFHPTQLDNEERERGKCLTRVLKPGRACAGKRLTHFRQNIFLCLFLNVYREAARECRRKKKEYIKCLENRVAVLENRNQTLIDELKSLKELYQQKTD